MAVAKGSSPVSSASGSNSNPLEGNTVIAAEGAGKTTPSTLSDDADDTTSTQGGTEGKFVRAAGSGKKRSAAVSHEADGPDASEEGLEGNRRKQRKSARLT